MAIAILPRHLTPWMTLEAAGAICLRLILQPFWDVLRAPIAETRARGYAAAVRYSAIQPTRKDR